MLTNINKKQGKNITVVIHIFQGNLSLIQFYFFVIYLVVINGRIELTTLE